MKAEDLRTLIARRLRVPQTRVTRDADLVCDLGADSLSLAEITGMIESETGERLSIEWLQDITTVGDLQDLVEYLQSDHHAPNDRMLPATAPQADEI